MKIIIASTNPAKRRAVEDAFTAQFAGHELEFEALNVPSGVSVQPMSDDETRRGARTRAGNAARAQSDATYWVGMEGGLEIIDGQLTAFAWMAVRDVKGRIGEARTVTLPLPPAVHKLIDTGMELGDANDRVFSTINSKQAGGAYGLLTGGRVTREGVYSQALTIALIPFVNPLYRGD